MAGYSSYKQIETENLLDGTVPTSAIAVGAGIRYSVLWVFNARQHSCQQCANNGGCTSQYDGRCCLWTVPTGVCRVTFELWSGGGGGGGNTCCNCCSHAVGGGGGNYAIKSITTVPGCQYRICAGGAWPCNKSHTCSGGMGCRSYVNGFNLDNFCVVGGCGGWMCNGDAWGFRHSTNGCASCNICAFFNADIGFTGTAGFKPGHGACHCHKKGSWTGMAPLIGLTQSNQATEYWCVCGCFSPPPATGGMSGISAYCGSNQKCCGGGIGGGSGIVKVTYA